jgi:ribulose-5-phosphate 4-epimerase/fuculose-1-phosphate aldolase
VGRSIADAFLAMFTLQRACEVQILAQSGGAELLRVDARVLAGVRDSARSVTRGLGGELAWPALLRRLDRIDESYRS